MDGCATYSFFGRDRLEGRAACKRAPIIPVTGPLRFEVFPIDSVFIQCLVVVTDPKCQCKPGARLVGQVGGSRT